MRLRLTLLLLISKIALAQKPADQILGIWMSEEKDLKVEIFKQNNHYFGKVIWFKCLPKDVPMELQKDTENPNPALRNRLWLGMTSVENLEFDNKKSWINGKIYDPNSGHTFSSTVRLENPKRLNVRGFWGIEFFGKSLYFNRISAN